jgi:hypothetical protein
MLKQVDHPRVVPSVEGGRHGQLTRREWGAERRKEGRLEVATPEFRSTGGCGAIVLLRNPRD